MEEAASWKPSITHYSPLKTTPEPTPQLPIIHPKSTVRHLQTGSGIELSDLRAAGAQGDVAPTVLGHGREDI